MATTTLYLLTTVENGNGFFQQMQDGGTAPTAATSGTGWKPAKTAVTTPFFKMQAGNAAFATATATTSATTLSAGTTTTTGGNAMRSPTAYTGTFANTAWSFTIGVIATTTGAVGKVNLRVFKSASASGASPTQLTTADLTPASSTTLSTTAANQTFTWSPGAITLNGEYLFFTIDWNETTAGSSNTDNVLLRVGSSVVTPDFVPAVNIAPTQASGAGVVNPPSSVVVQPFALPADFTTGSLPSGVTASGGANGTRVNASRLLAASSAPRFDYPAPVNLIVDAYNPTSANWAGYNGPTCATTTTPLGDGATNFFKVTATNNVATWHDAYHSLVSGQTYTYEFYAKNGNTGFIGFDWSVLGVSDTTVEFNLSTGAILSDNVTPAGGVARCDATNQTGVWRIAVTIPYSGTATANGAPFVSRGTGLAGASFGDTFLFCKPVLTQGSTPTLSLTIAPDARLLVEPAVTNLVGVNPSSIWNNVGSSWTAGTTTGPDGVANSAGTLTTLQQSNPIISVMTTPAAGTWTISGIFKAGTLPMVFLSLYDENGNLIRTHFNLSTGTIGTQIGTGNVSSMRALSNGFYECVMSAPQTAGGSNQEIIIGPNDTDGTNTNVNTSGGTIYCWGTNAYTGNPTSFINASNAARTADVISFTIPSGVSTLRYTFDDNSTQYVTVTPGAAYTVPTNLNRSRIASIASPGGPAPALAGVSGAAVAGAVTATTGAAPVNASPALTGVAAASATVGAAAASLASPTLTSVSGGGAVNAVSASAGSSLNVNLAGVSGGGAVNPVAATYSGQAPLTSAAGAGAVNPVAARIDESNALTGAAGAGAVTPVAMTYSGQVSLIGASGAGAVNPGTARFDGSGGLTGVAALAQVGAPTADPTLVYGTAHMRPSGDASSGSWTTDAGASTSLYSRINETTADDANYIRSKAMSSGETDDVIEVALGASAAPSSRVGFKVSYRVSLATLSGGGYAASLVVEFRQGTTVIATWTHSDLTASFATVTQTLSVAQATAITDFSDLRLRFIARSS